MIDVLMTCFTFTVIGAILVGWEDLALTALIGMIVLWIIAPAIVAIIQGG